MEHNLFSDREQQVVHLLLQGKGNKQIALDLGIAQRTVEFHLSNIYTKLNVGSRAEAILKLTEGDMRKTAGQVQVNSTVDSYRTSTDNKSKTTLRRVSVKKSSIRLALLLGILVLVSILVVYPKIKTPQASLVAQTTPSPEVTVMPILSSAAMIDLPAPTQEVIWRALPAIPPHTVNGYTAEVVSYYADMSHILFQVHVTSAGKTIGRDYVLGYPNLFDEYGSLLNASVGYGPAIDPALVQFSFSPAPMLTTQNVKGQFVFQVQNPTNGNDVLAQFDFDFDIPILEETRAQPKETVTANGLEILLDSVATRPGFTQIYLCFRPPSRALWTIGANTTLRIGDLEAPLYISSELFDSFTGSYWGIQSEPYWIPPTKTDSCTKLGFEIGSQEPTSFTLTIPDLVNLLVVNQGPKVFMPDLLATNYPGLNVKEAYHTYLEEQGNTIKGPWIFEVMITP